MREQSKKQSLQIQTGVKQKISSLLSFCSKGPDVSWCLWAPLGRTELAWLGSEKGAPAFLGFWQCLWPLGSPWFPPCYQCLIRHHLTHRKTKRNLGEEGGFQLQWQKQSHEGSQNMGQSWGNIWLTAMFGDEAASFGCAFLQRMLNVPVPCSRTDFLKQPPSKGLDDWVWQRQHCHLLASLPKAVC